MRHSQDVRARLLEAARAEFAEYGFAGARVDRIARAATASKERLYAHFADKQALFQAVVSLDAQEFFDAVALDPENLAEFVGRVFDHSLSTPQHLRMLTWARLDDVALALPDGEPGGGSKLEAIASAQASGLVDPSWDHHDLLPMLFALGFAWAQSPDPSAQQGDADARARRRAAAVEAARRILAAPPG